MGKVLQVQKIEGRKGMEGWEGSKGREEEKGGRGGSKGRVERNGTQDRARIVRLDVCPPAVHHILYHRKCCAKDGLRGVVG